VSEHSCPQRRRQRQRRRRRRRRRGGDRDDDSGDGDGGDGGDSGDDSGGDGGRGGDGDSDSGGGGGGSDSDSDGGGGASDSGDNDGGNNGGGISSVFLRHLDKEFGNAIKANDHDFNWMRLPSVMELCGELAEEYVVAAQSKLDHSRKKSLVTAFQTFRRIIEYSMAPSNKVQIHNRWMFVHSLIVHCSCGTPKNNHREWYQNWTTEKSRKPPDTRVAPHTTTCYTSVSWMPSHAAAHSQLWPHMPPHTPHARTNPHTHKHIIIHTLTHMHDYRRMKKCAGMHIINDRDTHVLLDRDELEADQLLLKTELKRHETKSGREKNNMQTELNELACDRTYLQLTIGDGSNYARLDFIVKLCIH
jgi:hypothetical protein